MPKGSTHRGDLGGYWVAVVAADECIETAEEALATAKFGGTNEEGIGLHLGYQVSIKLTYSFCRDAYDTAQLAVAAAMTLTFSMA